MRFIRKQIEDLEKEKTAFDQKIDSLSGERDSIDQEKEKLQNMLKAIAEERRRKEEEERLERERLAREAEQAKAKAAAKELEEKLEAERAAEQARLESERLARGNQITYLIDRDVADFVDRSFSDRVTSIACGGNATIMLYEHGGWAWSAGIPKHLHNKLNGRQRTLPNPRTWLWGAWIVTLYDLRTENRNGLVVTQWATT